MVLVTELQQKQKLTDAKMTTSASSSDSSENTTVLFVRRLTSTPDLICTLPEAMSSPQPTSIPENQFQSSHKCYSSDPKHTVSYQERSVTSSVRMNIEQNHLQNVHNTGLAVPNHLHPH